MRKNAWTLILQELRAKYDIFVGIFISVKNCGDPGAPANGLKIGNEFTYGKDVWFDCNPGFKLQGSSQRICEATGTWSGTQATCVGKNSLNLYK